MLTNKKDIYDVHNRKVEVGDLILISGNCKCLSTHIVLRFTASGMMLSKFSADLNTLKRYKNLIVTKISGSKIEIDNSEMYKARNADYNDINKHNDVYYHYFTAPYSIYILEKNIKIPTIFNKYIKK